jgi:ribonucleoside-diphosphate reductase alpha chain
MNSELVNFFNGDELAASVWQGKYALSNEKTPDDMHKRLATEFARIRGKKDLSKSYDEHYEDIYGYFKGFKYIVPQGSVMSMLGNKDKVGSLSNCFVIGEVPDSYGGIMQKDEELAQLMKRRGGVGLDISSLRPANTVVNNAAKTSTGAISFMERFSNSTREVAQAGRRGALIITIDVLHPDALEFIKIKRDLTKVTGANITVKLRDGFMKCVENQGDYIQRFPIDTDVSKYNVSELEYNVLFEVHPNVFIKRIKASDLWDEINESAHASAEPGSFFIDRHWNYSPDGVYPQYKGVTSNPCGEIFMQEYDACRLILLNLFSFVDDPYTPHATINYDLLYERAYEMQKLADDLVDLELEHIDRIISKINSDPESDDVKYRELKLWEKIKKVAANGRRTGSGITALGDMLAALNVPYDSEEAMEIIDNVMRTKFQAELNATIELAKKSVPFEGWNANQEFEFTLLPDGTINLIKGKNDFYQFMVENFKDEVIEMIKYGRRNVSWSTVAPAGSVSICTQTTSGIEPLFMMYYTRRKKINPSENIRIDFVDQNGDSWQEFPVFHKKIFDWAETKGIDKNTLTSMPKDKLDEILKTSPWYNSTANDIDWINRVKIQAIIQKYTTHSISSTLNLPNDVTVDKCKEIYLKSWKYGLKGVTIYRDGCRTGVLIDSSKNNQETPFEYNDALKRPSDLPCNVHRLTALGEKWVVFIGMIDNKPFELFAVLSSEISGTIPLSCDEGFISKQKKGCYKFTCGENVISNISDYMRNDDERADTRMYSLMLRHGIHPKYIIEQIEKSAGIITSFNKAIARTLKKYLTVEELKSQKCSSCGSSNMVLEEGCSKCLDCGESKCG